MLDLPFIIIYHHPLKDSWVINNCGAKGNLEMSFIINFMCKRDSLDYYLISAFLIIQA